MKREETKRRIFNFRKNFMIKGKIVCKEKRDNKIYLRIKIDQNTQKRYNQFRHELISKYRVEKKGCYGFTEIIGSGIEIEVFKREDYMHLIIRGPKRLREEILKILFKYFEFAKR